MHRHRRFRQSRVLIVGCGDVGLRAAQQLLPRCRVLALSMHKDSVYVREILKAGARGYLLKDALDKDLVAAVQALMRGEGYLSPAVSDLVLTDYRRHVTNPIDLLTSREREVLQMIAEGKTNTLKALLYAFSVDPEVPQKTAFTGADRNAMKSKLDTVSFLSDGRPSVGKLVDTNEILKE